MVKVLCLRRRARDECCAWVRGVGGIFEMCMCLARGGVGVGVSG